MKIIMVKTCKDCLYINKSSQHRFYTEGYCDKTHQPIPDINSIPEFCPLEDLEKKMNEGFIENLDTLKKILSNPLMNQDLKIIIQQANREPHIMKAKYIQNIAIDSNDDYGAIIYNDGITSGRFGLKMDEIFWIKLSTKTMRELKEYYNKSKNGDTT